jgi:hypothetical protein
MKKIELHRQQESLDQQVLLVLEEGFRRVRSTDACVKRNAGLRDARESLGGKASARLQKRPQEPTPQEQIYTAWKNLDFGGMGVEHQGASAIDLFTRAWTYPSFLPPPLCLLRPERVG